MKQRRTEVISIYGTLINLAANKLDILSAESRGRSGTTEGELDGTSGGQGERDGTSGGKGELDGTNGGKGELNRTNSWGHSGSADPRGRLGGSDPRGHSGGSDSHGRSGGSDSRGCSGELDETSGDEDELGRTSGGT